MKNKVVLITGASRGIGRATAIEFAKLGASIVINYQKNDSKAESLVSQLKLLTSKVVAIKADISNPSEVEYLKNQFLKHFSSIDILVNNAGIVFDVDFEKATLEQWKKTYDVNVLGTFLCCRKFMPHFSKNGGAIVNLSSTSGMLEFTPSSMAYDASKASISSMTHSLAKEFSTLGVRVNAVAPGWVDTGMNSSIPKDELQKYLSKNYLKRMAQPIEVAKVIRFLSSSESSFVNGTTLVVDGGTG